VSPIFPPPLWAKSSLEILRTLPELRAWRKSVNSKIGFVPTMGALHAGHLKLISTSVQNNSTTIVSIFVNPLQFGPKEDLAKYPRPFEKDCELCEKAGVSAVFAPEVAAFYSTDHSTSLDVQGLDQYLCGVTRPGHFRGVCTVVLKLFNLVQPTNAYFGQKDIQQALILRKMVADLSVDLNLEIVETVRETSGLALSSRNIYLSEDEKNRATSLSRGIKIAKVAWQAGEKSAQVLKTLVQKEIEASVPTKLDYVEIVSQNLLQPIENVDEPVVIAVAVFYGTTRLIDNLLFG